MKTIETQITINETAHNIWKILTDFEKYPLWNPFIKSISGAIQKGESLQVSIQPVGNKAMSFKPVILELDENKELRWKGKVLINGLFDGEHYFILKQNNDGTTTFTQGEKFSGILVGLFKQMFIATEQGFKQMNEALKQRSESV